MPGPYVPYDTRLTLSVLARLQGIVWIIRILFALWWGGFGSFWGGVAGAAISFYFSPRPQLEPSPNPGFPLGALIGGLLGVGLGLVLAYLVTVWVEWAEQVLRALHGILYR
jgi:hypothetical protein